MSRSTVNLPELVQSVVDAHRDERGPLLVVLQELQERLGRLDPEVVPLVAAELNLSRADVHGVVAFYRDFHSDPHGRAVLRICRAEACKSVGAEDLVAQVETTLGVKTGETTPDGAVTLDQVFCLGNCALGPAAQVNGRLYGRLTPDRVLDVMRRAAS
ncbi:NADH-quinone oxidoreductase subunit NuoE family protein [Saccharopolyspora sp. NPDC000995]